MAALSFVGSFTRGLAGLAVMDTCNPSLWAPARPVPAQVSVKATMKTTSSAAKPSIGHRRENEAV